MALAIALDRLGKCFEPERVNPADSETLTRLVEIVDSRCQAVDGLASPIESAASATLTINGRLMMAAQHG